MLLSSELFLDCILLLIHDNSDSIKDAILEIIEIFENDAKTNTTLDDEITRFYIRVVKAIIQNNVTKADQTELKMILLKFKSDKAVSGHREIFDLLLETFTAPDRLSNDKLHALSLKIQNTLIWHKTNKKVRTMFGQLNRAADMLNPVHQQAALQDLLAAANEVSSIFTSTSMVDTSAEGMVEKVDFSDLESIGEAIVKHKERTVKGVSKFGLQGLNLMFWPHGGATQGESIVFNALSHNYKSGILMSVAKWIALYNTPPKDPEGKKPLILFFSLENEAYQNTMQLFRQHYETTHLKSSKELTDEQVKLFIYEWFNERGYTLIIERWLPSDFGFLELVKRVTYYENTGYRVHTIIIDYMNTMKKSGPENGKTSDGGTNHLAVRALYSATCNFTKSKGITLFTAHQLNRKAYELANSGVINVVKKFSPEHLADSMDVQREVDTAVYMYIEKNHSGDPYLTFYLSKRRYVDGIPERVKYTAYKFTQWGILDDVNGTPGFVRDIYAESGDRSNDASDNGTAATADALY